MSNKKNCYEQNKEKMKEYARNRYHLSSGKIIPKTFFMEITKKSCKNKYEIDTEIFQKKKKKKKNMEKIDIKTCLKR